jgi:hypothetical protein
MRSAYRMTPAKNSTSSRIRMSADRLGDSDVAAARYGRDMDLRSEKWRAQCAVLVRVAR